MTVEKRTIKPTDELKGCKKIKSGSITDFFRSKAASSTDLVTKMNDIIESSNGAYDCPNESTESHKVVIEGPLSYFKRAFIEKLTPDQKELLELEINTLEDSWFEQLHKEFTKPYFLQLKTFLRNQWEQNIQIFPAQNDIYSWSRLTPLKKTKIIILGQDPYHNVNQAHGLAFSVKYPTKPPPSLVNIYKTLKIDYPNFQIPKDKGDLSAWTKQGVLMLNTCLTVKAHEANSHAKKGWEQFTEAILKVVLQDTERKKVVLLWGSPAQKRFDGLKLRFNEEDVFVLRSVHPSPLSARRGFFECGHFRKANEWLTNQGLKPIDWRIV